MKNIKTQNLNIIIFLIGVEKLKGSHYFELVDDVKVVDSNFNKYSIGYDNMITSLLIKERYIKTEIVFYFEETTGVNLSTSAVQPLK